MLRDSSNVPVLRRTSSVVLLSLFVTTVGCGGVKIETAPVQPDPPALSPPAFLALLTEGVRIVAEDGSWEVVGGGDPIPSPFLGPSMDESMLTSKEAFAAALAETDLNEEQIAEQVRTYSAPRVFDIGWIIEQQPETMLDWYQQYLTDGAQRVRVHVAGRQAPLYGVLALLPVYATADPVARRAYRVEVPSQRIDQASGARVSMVFQPYKFTYMQKAPKALVGEVKWVLQQAEGGHTSWALWLSDAPFPGS